MSSPTETYSGFAELLAVEQHLRRYTTDIVSKMGQHFTGRTSVLEFGAGIGTLAAEWQRQTGVQPECLEIDGKQRQMILDRGFVCYPSTVAVTKKFSGIYSSNVLEHVDDDTGMLQELNGLMLDGSLLALYVPAFMCLYSTFDRYLGHYRRYHKAELIEKVTRAGFTVIKCQYVDSIGFFAWYVAKLFGSAEGADLPGGASLRFYDSYVYPISKTMDSLIMKGLLGKNLLLIAKK